MDATTQIPPSRSEEKQWAWPWYITAALLVGLCLLYCHFTYSNFWSLPEKNLGRFLGYLVAAFILLPITAAVAAIVWLVVAKVRKPCRYAFGPFWVVSLAIAVVLLFVGTKYRGMQEDAAFERKMADAKVSAKDFDRIELFDGSMSWAHSYGGQSDAIDQIRGRVRNGLTRPLISVRVRVGIQNADGKLIEAFDFVIPELGGSFGSEPLQPGHARGFSYGKRIERIPRDMKWAWGVIDATYDFK